MRAMQGNPFVPRSFRHGRRFWPELSDWRCPPLLQTHSCVAHGRVPLATPREGWRRYPIHSEERSSLLPRRHPRIPLDEAVLLSPPPSTLCACRVSLAACRMLDHKVCNVVDVVLKAGRKALDVFALVYRILLAAPCQRVPAAPRPSTSLPVLYRPLRGGLVPIGPPHVCIVVLPQVHAEQLPEHAWGTRFAVLFIARGG